MGDVPMAKAGTELVDAAAATVAAKPQRSCSIQRASDWSRLTRAALGSSLF